MYRALVLIIFPLFFAIQVQSQKVHRAAKAMNELRFEKSFELFEEVLAKEPNNVVALIGFAKSHLKENETNNNHISIEVLQLCYDNLMKGKSRLQFVKEDEAKLLLIDRLIFDKYSIDSLLNQASNLIWNGYIKEETSITKFEFFQENYYKENRENPANLLEEKLDKLYFDSLSNVNTISSYSYYLDKFDKSKYVKGVYSNEAKAKILRIEYKEAYDAGGIDRLSLFITKNRIKTFEGVAKMEYEGVLKLATKEIEKREFKRALSDPGVKLLEAFVKNYKTSNDFFAAVDTIEHRYYSKAKNTQALSDYELFLSKYEVSKFKNEVEDSVASIYFKNTIESNRKADLVGFIEKVNGYHTEELIQVYVDSTKNKIYNLDYIEALNTTDLVTLIEFYRNYKTSHYASVPSIKKKLFSTWEQSIIKANTSPDENGLVNFIHEFEEEPAISFNKVIESTKLGLLKYAESVKSKIVSNILKNSSKNNSSIYNALTSDKLENLSSLIASRLYFNNTTTNKEVIDNIKNIDASVNPPLLELFNQFFINFTTSNSYVESVFEDNDQAFLFGYQTREKFVTKVLLWDDMEMRYKELDILNKENNLLKSFMTQTGLTDLGLYVNSPRTKFNYALIGSKINKAALLNLAEGELN